MVSMPKKRTYVLFNPEKVSQYLTLPNNFTYPQLLAEEERVGNVSTTISLYPDQLQEVLDITNNEGDVVLSYFDISANNG